MVRYRQQQHGAAGGEREPVHLLDARRFVPACFAANSRGVGSTLPRSHPAEYSKKYISAGPAHALSAGIQNRLYREGITQERRKGRQVREREHPIRSLVSGASKPVLQ